MFRKFYLLTCFLLASAIGLPGTAPADTVPSPWTNQDIGTTGGSADYSPGTGGYTVVASGADIWSTSDQFHFVYQSITGSGTITARVVSIEPLPTYALNPWAKAGVMFREDLAGGSKWSMVSITGDSGCRM